MPEMNIYNILCMPLRDVVPLGITIVFSFIFGSCLGSFLNVCIWRIPLGESVVVVPSHCPKCNHKIRWFDNVPVIGFLALGGKCRDCKAPISPRYIIMELLVGALFTIQSLNIWLNKAEIHWLIAVIIMLSVAVPCAFIDIEHRKLPDKLTYFGMIAGVLYCWIFPSYPVKTHPDGLLLSLIGLAAGVFGLGFFAWITCKCMKKRTLGGGDVKYAGFLGALYGLPGLLVTLLFASVLAIIYYLLFRKKYARDGFLPFGPFLGIAVYLYMLLGLIRIG